MEERNDNNNDADDLSVPPNILRILHELLGFNGLNNDTSNLRPSIANIYPFIVCIYALLVGTGVILNLYVFYDIVRNKLYNDPTYSFIINNVVSDLVKCVFIVPITLYVLLINNWTLGELLCSFLPMIQDIPMHTTTLTFLLMAWDRYRFIRNPNKPRLPAFVCTIGTWLTAICMVLPYPIYIIYVDIGKYVPKFQGIGICTINLADDMQEYMRGIFLVMYAAPLATISYLYIRVSRELQTQQSSIAVVMFETRGRDSVGGGRPRTDSHSTTTDFRSSSRGDCDRSSEYSRNSYSRGIGAADHHDLVSRAHFEHYDVELDVIKEKRTQKYLVPMVTFYAMCLCPLMILRLARLVLHETYANAGHFDITYTAFVWLAFVPTCSTPIVYIIWQMSRSSKERLRGYFRFSNRRLRQSCETVITAAGTPAPIPKANSHHPNYNNTDSSSSVIMISGEENGRHYSKSNVGTFQQDFASS